MDKLKYIDKEFYEAQLNVDLIVEDQIEEFDKAVYYASALLNAFTGNRIEGVGFENLTPLQQSGVKEATIFQVAHFLNSGELDGQRGSGSFATGGMAYSFNMPGEGEKTLRIDEKAIFSLQRVGLLNTTVAFDPIKERKKREEPKRKHIYHKWNIESMDDSLFVSDGTNIDGGKVRLKISDSFQHEINKVEHIGKVKNHLVYTDNPDSNMDDWNDNALIHKSYLKKHYPDSKKLRLEWYLFKSKVIETIEHLKINLKQWAFFSWSSEPSIIKSPEQVCSN